MTCEVLEVTQQNTAQNISQVTNPPPEVTYEKIIYSASQLLATRGNFVCSPPRPHHERKEGRTEEGGGRLELH